MERFYATGSRIWARAIRTALRSSRTVSYTHLDVYKRQAYTEPGARGDTSGNVTKLGRLETGLEIKVPLYIQVGEKVKVYTETREFAGRA